MDFSKRSNWLSHWKLNFPFKAFTQLSASGPEFQLMNPDLCRFLHYGVLRKYVCARCREMQHFDPSALFLWNTNAILLLQGWTYANLTANTQRPPRFPFLCALTIGCTWPVVGSLHCFCASPPKWSFVNPYSPCVTWSTSRTPACLICDQVIYTYPHSNGRVARPPKHESNVSCGDLQTDKLD